MHIRGVRVIDRPVSIHRARVVRSRPVALGDSLQPIAPALRLLPRRQRNRLLRRVAPGYRRCICPHPRRSAAHHCKTAEPSRAPRTPQPPLCSTKGHIPLSLGRAGAAPNCENPPGTPPDTPAIRSDLGANTLSLRCAFRTQSIAPFPLCDLASNRLRNRHLDRSPERAGGESNGRSGETPAFRTCL